MRQYHVPQHAQATHPNHEQVDDVQRRLPSGETLWNRDGIVCIIVCRLRGVGSLVKDVAHERARRVALATIAWRETDDDGNDVNVFGVPLSMRVSKRYTSSRNAY